MDNRIDNPHTTLESREDFIANYFQAGFTNKEILAALIIRHGIKLSLRHLKRLLNKLNLRRFPRGFQESPREDIVASINQELQASGKCLGYRAMWRRLKQQHSLFVKRDTVLKLLWELDPDGVSSRKAKRMNRRKYISPGPSFTWHCDGYDKLKPFGFCLHGAIDGYSRKVLWLEVGPSNNNPKIIAHYFLKCVKNLGHTPRVLRCDLGTENTNLAFIQPFLRSSDNDEFAGVKSFVYGKSTANQRIEAFWAVLRKGLTDWWIKFFKDMRDSGLYCDSNIFHTELLQFCFIHILKRELKIFVNEWNSHNIYVKKNSECQEGKPDIMFHLPEVNNTISYGSAVRDEDIAYCMLNYTEQPADEPFSEEFLELVHLLMPEIEVPVSANDALDLYKNLSEKIESYED